MDHKFRSAVILAALISACVQVALAQTTVQEARVRAHMEFLASDEMQGRGSGTEFEKLAGLYIASQLKQFGVAPAGDKDGKSLGQYLQTVMIERMSLGETKLQFGEQMNVGLTALRVGSTEVEGKLQRLKVGETAEAGTIALVTTNNGDISREELFSLFGSPANAVIVVANTKLMGQFAGFARRGSSITKIRGGTGAGFTPVYLIREEDVKALDGVSDETSVGIQSDIAESKTSYTWNAVGRIEGTADSGEAILLSAHMDHVGVNPNAPGDDKIFNGADDDASGCVAVLELARILAEGAKPKRTVYFAFFGSEEAGGFGSRYFVDNLGFPLEKLVANLQFEMLGRPDAKVGKDELWLTGYERSDLGSELANNGAKLVADPHPGENFFERSDNITLARRGVVAHTVSSFGLHKDYHRASDEIDTIDFPYMANAIDSMVKPVIWLANTDWKPEWKAGMKP